MCYRPDYEACAALAERTLNSSDCGAAHCVLGAPQPATSGEFIALAGKSPDLLYISAIYKAENGCGVQSLIRQHVSTCACFPIAAGFR